jgi:flagellar basal-body rod modification protein FlgD
MTTTSAVTGTTASTATGTTGTSSTDASDRFLKLLVTQMQNQDPLNPMDNAEVTSQMAQINTVTGIDKLNTTMTSLTANMTQAQLLQGASLVGHAVLVNGDQLNVGTDGTATAGYELTTAASNVRIDILDSAGAVVDTVTQSGKAAGRQGFTWTPEEGMTTTGLTFKVTATSSGKSVAATPLMSDLVDAVSTTTDGTLNLELRYNGTTAYSGVKAVS